MKMKKNINVLFMIFGFMNVSSSENPLNIQRSNASRELNDSACKLLDCEKSFYNCAGYDYEKYPMNTCDVISTINSSRKESSQKDSTKIFTYPIPDIYHFEVLAQSLNCKKNLFPENNQLFTTPPAHNKFVNYSPDRIDRSNIELPKDVFNCKRNLFPDQKTAKKDKCDFDQKHNDSEITFLGKKRSKDKK